MLRFGTDSFLLEYFTLLFHEGQEYQRKSLWEKNPAHNLALEFRLTNAPPQKKCVVPILFAEIARLKSKK